MYQWGNGSWDGNFSQGPAAPNYETWVCMPEYRLPSCTFLLSCPLLSAKQTRVAVLGRWLGSPLRCCESTAWKTVWRVKLKRWSEARNRSQRKVKSLKIWEQDGFGQEGPAQRVQNVSVYLERVHLRDIQQGDGEMTYRSSRHFPWQRVKL